MNNNILSHLIRIGLFLVILTPLVGCSLGEVEQAAASDITTSAENGDTGIDPADRKFFTAPYLTAPVVAIDPADRKFFDGGYMANYAASESLTHLSNIDPADRKFFSGGYDTAGSVAKLAAGVDPAGRNSSSGN